MRAKASMVATLALFTENDEKVSTKVLAGLDSCFGLIRLRQHGIANKMVHGFPQKKEARKVYAMLKHRLG